MPRFSTYTRPGGGAAARPVAVQRKTVAALTLEALRENILRGVYPEGAPLRQDALAADLGVSRIPVREALRQLEVEGLVVFRPHVGVVLSSLELSEIQELFDIRSLIEVDLLRRALPALTAADVDRAAEILDAFEEAMREQDVAAWGALNWDFHAALLSPAGRPLAMQILQHLRNQSDRYTRLQLSLTHGEGRAREEHRAILLAVQNREMDHACALLAAHILGAGRTLTEFLRVHRSSGQTPPQERVPRK